MEKNKCSECNSPTNDRGDIHCRKIFKVKVEVHISNGDLLLARDLCRTTNFINPDANIWKDAEKKIIEKLIRVEAIEEIKNIEVKIQHEEALGDYEKELLVMSHKYELLGDYHRNRFQINKDPWELSKSCKNYRLAGMPELGIKVADQLSNESSDIIASSAVLVSKGAAFKDLRELEEAKRCAYKAIEYNRTFYPFTLLGAIEILEENFEMADRSFQEATRLGAPMKAVAREIKNASENLSEEAKEKMEKIFYGRQVVK